MAHSIKDYKFETEVEATIFANQQREDKCPSEDKYVMGPVYMDDEKIFTGTSLEGHSKTKWWQVTIECFR